MFLLGVNVQKICTLMPSSSVTEGGKGESQALRHFPLFAKYADALVDELELD